VSERFTLADHVVCRQTNQELRMLFDRNKGVMYELNETATEVVAFLQRVSAASVDDIAAECAQIFDAPLPDIKDDVAGMLADFADAGLVVVQ
jgi:hypothetical protein